MEELRTIAATGMVGYGFPEASLDKLQRGKIKPMGPVPELTARDVERAERIVGMMGAEPMIKALEAGRVKVAGSQFVPAERYTIKLEGAQCVGLSPSDYQVKFRLYGKNGVMGAGEPQAHEVGHELGVVIDVVGHTQEVANDVLAIARTLMLHTEFEGRLCIAGNMVFPYSPSDIPVGPVYRFSLWHLLEVDDPCAGFPMELVQI